MGKSLKDLKIGDSAVIGAYVSGKSDYKRKLLSMGLTTGTSIKLLKVAPLGDPVELEVRGYKLSLRVEEASVLLLKEGSR